MRTYGGEVERRSFGDMILAAVGVLRQDAGEFLFIGVLGGLLTTAAALILRFTGGYAGLALITPAIVTGALLTMAATCSAVRRVEDNLEPDAGAALAATLVRTPFIVMPLAPALLLSGLAAFVGVGLRPHIGSLFAITIALALSAFAAAFLFRRSLYVPALFARRTSSRHAWARAAAVVEAYPLMVGLGWLLALAPTLVLGLLTMQSGFGPAGIAITAFVFASSMPFAGALMTLLFTQADGALPQSPTAPSLAPPSSGRRGPAHSSDVADQLRRRMR